MKVGDRFKFSVSMIDHACELIQIGMETVRFKYIYGTTRQGTSIVDKTASVSSSYYLEHTKPLTKLEELLWNLR